MIRQMQKQMRNVVVVNYEGDNVALLLPLYKNNNMNIYVNLITSRMWNDIDIEDRIVNWVIRPGDQAQFNGDFTGVYRGIKISLDHIIYIYIYI